MKRREVTTFATKENFLENYRVAMNNQYGKELEEAGMIEKYVVLAEMVRSSMVSENMDTKKYIKNNGSKQLYYFSLEFLMGRMLRNNLMSSGYYEVVKEGLKDINVDIEELEDIELSDKSEARKLIEKFVDENPDIKKYKFLIISFHF